MSARLLCRVRAGLRLAFDLEEREAVLGRDPGLAVALPVEGVSRRHARVTWDGKSHWIEDLRSTNGTFLNGQAVVRERLRHLDVVTLGREVDLLYLTRRAEVAAQPARVITRVTLAREGSDAPPYEIALGEITLGRSQSCNVVSDSQEVSKVHARIERTRDQLLLEDLGSANGTFVNGVSVKTAFLNAGDLLTLAGGESFRVEIRTEEATLGSGRHSATLAREAGRERQRFSADWKTRILGSEQDRDELSDLRRRMADYDRQRAAAGVTVKPVRPAAPPAPPAAATPKPAAATPKPAAAPAPKPRTPAAASPAATPEPAAKAPAPPKALDVPKPADPPKPSPAPPPVGIPPKPVTKTVPAAAPPVSAGAAKTPEVKPAAAIAELRLRGEGVDLVVTEPGEHELGRVAEAALRVDHKTVSRRQARIILSADRTRAFVQDQGGVNKTRLNGQALEKLAALDDGDVLRVGEVELRVTITRR